MKAFSPSTTFATLAVVFALAACSTPNDLTAIPTLEPQFGSADDDIGVDVAVGPSGSAFTFSSRAGGIFEGEEQTGYYEKALLQRYNSSGSLLWTREVSSLESDFDRENHYFQDIDIHTLKSDAQGNAYALTSGVSVSFNGYDVAVQGYGIAKYNAAGTRIAGIGIGTGIQGVSGGDLGTATFAVDNGGKVYAGAIECTEVYDGSEPDAPAVGGDCAYYVSKHLSTSPNGELLWQRASTVGTPYGITVTSAGNVYVIGSLGMARYSSSGSLIWTKTGSGYAVGPYSQIAPSGSNLYVRDVKVIRKYDANGKLLWTRSQGGLNTLVLQDMTADGSGNIYLSGKYNAGNNFNPFGRKLSPSGSVLWTKTFGTTAYDDARGIATLSGSTIYLTGETQGSLAHPNRGGPENRDGYLRKLNSSGNPLWTR